MTDKNAADIGFEKEIWDAACVLRGNMDASEYKNVILGLIFLKYISDSFETKYNQLVEEGEGFEEDRDEYDADNIFWVPAGARWKDIAQVAHKPEIGVVIDKAMALIEAENKKLKGILPKNFARPEMDKRRLGDVVDLFTNVQMSDGADEKDLLGRTYEYCLRNFAEQEGKNAGQFYTPSCVVRTIVEVLKPFNGRVYDPCCGAGGMFVQSADFIKNHQGNINSISVYGQESNPTTWKMAKMNLAIRGIDCNLGEIPEDTFLNDQHPTMRADFIMANPPFNLTPWGVEKLKEDQRWKYGTPPASNANYAWIQHMIWHLAPEGRIGLVLANTALSISSGSEYEIRKKIIEDDLVECIVALPAGLFYSTKIKVSLWFMNKQKKQKGKILFIDSRNMGHMATRTLKEFSDDDIKKISNTVERFQNDNDYLDEIGFCAVATIEEIKQKGYNLSPSKHVKGVISADNVLDWVDNYEFEVSEYQRLQLEAAEAKIRIQEILGSGTDSNSTNCQYLSDMNLASVLSDNPSEIADLLANIIKFDGIASQITKTSNEISDQLFKYWFVDYNFPNKEGIPYLENSGEVESTSIGMIPVDWKVIRMGQFLESKNERVGDTEGIPEYSTTNNGLIPRSEKFNKVLSKNSSKYRVIRYGDIVFGMSREIFNFGVMKEEVGCVSPAYHVYKIDERIINPEFLEIYMNICSEFFLSLIKPGAREGQVLDKDELERKEIILPPMTLQNRYMSLRKLLPHVLLREK